MRSLAHGRPEEIRQVFRLLSAFNLNLDIVAPECLNPDLAYWQKFAGIEALPLIFTLMFAVVLSAKLVYKRLCTNASKDQLWAHTPGLISTFIVIFRLCVPSRWHSACGGSGRWSWCALPTPLTPSVLPFPLPRPVFAGST